LAWILTNAAESDLDWIAAEGARQFGYQQSERYERELADALDLLAEMPHLGVERSTGSENVRLMPCGVHNILYVVKDGDVLVLRILHGLQNWVDVL
jgi:toxin ParE1/3/4